MTFLVRIAEEDLIEEKKVGEGIVFTETGEIVIKMRKTLFSIHCLTTMRDMEDVVSRIFTRTSKAT